VLTRTFGLLADLPATRAPQDQDCVLGQTKALQVSSQALNQLFVPSSLTYPTCSGESQIFFGSKHVHDHPCRSKEKAGWPI